MGVGGCVFECMCECVYVCKFVWVGEVKEEDSNVNFTGYTYSSIKPLRQITLIRKYMYFPPFSQGLLLWQIIYS